RSLDRLPRDREIVVYCKGGVRSAQAAEQLVQAGFGAVTNVVGGITAWSVEIDPSVPRY
ncbi:MAG: rhodanese-like domain-containing protein, partial [Gemmatimonadales bacterium]|nr:rhodanese-like domain-containing protein [Gemmatimonadales bacterium]